MSTITISGQLDRREFVTAALLHSRPQYGFAVWGTVGGLATVALVAVQYLRPTAQRDWLLPGIFTGLALFFLTLFGVILPARAGRLYDQTASSRLSFQLTFSEAGFQVASDLGAAKLPWSHVRKWRQNSTVVLLYQNDASYIVVPKRLCTPADVTALEALLHSALGAAS